MRKIEKRSRKYRIWRDERDLEAGCRIDSTIQEAIDRCSAVLFVVTKNSVESEYCLDEIARGREKKKTIVPLRLDPDAELPFRLHGVKYIDFSVDFDSGIKELCTFLVREWQASPLSPVTTKPVESNTAQLHVSNCFLGPSGQHQPSEKKIDAHNWPGECRDLANLAIGKQESGDLVGTTLYCMAALELARQTGDRTWEAHVWNIIGGSLASLGQISTAIQTSECALKLTRDNNLEREIEVVSLVHLAQCHAALDDGNQAEATCVGACRIAQAIGYRLGESIARQNLGILRLSRGSYESAIEDLTKAKELADVTRSVQLQQTTRLEIATALLLGGELSEAEATVDEALRYDTLLFSSEAHVLRGVIRQRQRKAREAAGSFYDALDKAQAVLKQTSRHYRALDVMGLSYSGLTLAEETNDYLDGAVEAYEAARPIANKPGIVRRRLRLFEALAQTDSGRKLAKVREAIDPEH